MTPLKKTYLVKLDKLEQYEDEGGILTLNPTAEYQLSWKGTVVAHGTAWTEEERKDLVPIGTRVVMTYGKNTQDKGGIKLVIKGVVYMIRGAEDILGVLEDE